MTEDDKLLQAEAIRVGIRFFRPVVGGGKLSAPKSPTDASRRVCGREKNAYSAGFGADVNEPIFRRTARRTRPTATALWPSTPSSRTHWTRLRSIRVRAPLFRSARRCRDGTNGLGGVDDVMMGVGYQELKLKLLTPFLGFDCISWILPSHNWRSDFISRIYFITLPYVLK